MSNDPSSHRLSRTGDTAARMLRPHGALPGTTEPVSGARNVAHRLIHGLPIYLVLTAGVFVLGTFFNIAAFDDGSSGDRAVQSMPLPLLGRLCTAMAATAMGAWAVLCSFRTRQAFATIPGILFTALGFVFMVTSIFAFAEIALVARSAALIFVGYLMFTAAVATSFRLETVLRLLLGVSVLFLLTSWFLYVFIPAKGVFLEHTVIGTQVPRMGGTAHPNVVGREAAVAILMGAGLLRMIPNWRDKPLQILLLWGVIGLGLATLAATKSRTSTLAVLLALGLLMGDRFLTRRGIVLCGLGVITVLGSLLLAEMAYDGQFLSEKVLDKVTKTGRADELTSATGRTDIWNHALELLWQRPWTGWGLDSAASLEIAAGSTHNLLLNIAFSSGVFAAAVGIPLILWTAFYGLASPVPVVRGLCGYLLISGLVEDTVLESFPGTLTLLWMIILMQSAWIQSCRRSAADSPDKVPQSDPPESRPPLLA